MEFISNDQQSLHLTEGKGLIFDGIQVFLSHSCLLLIARRRSPQVQRSQPVDPANSQYTRVILRRLASFIGILVGIGLGII